MLAPEHYHATVQHRQQVTPTRTLTLTLTRTLTRIPTLTSLDT